MASRLPNLLQRSSPRKPEARLQQFIEKHPDVVGAEDVSLHRFGSRIVVAYPFAWQELILALLTGHGHLQVLPSLSALHFNRPAELQSLLFDY